MESIEGSKACEEKCQTDNLENEPDSSFIHYAGSNGAPENLGEDSGDNFGQVLKVKPGEIREETTDSQINDKDLITNVDKIKSDSHLLHNEDDNQMPTETKEKSSNTSAIIKTRLCSKIPVANACDSEESINSDVQEMPQNNIEPCDMQVSHESSHLEGIHPEAVASLGSDVQENHVYVVSSPIGQHMPADFHSQANTDKNLKIQVEYDYGDMPASQKAIEGYHSGGRYIPF